MASTRSGRNLLVLARGISPGDLGSDAFRQFRPDGSAILPLDRAPDGAAPAAAELLDALPVDVLRRRGVAVDRRALQLQPPWRSDHQAVELLTTRPDGPPDLAVLDMRGPLLAATRHGAGSAAVAAAHAALAADLARGLEVLRRGGPASLWLCALGAPVPVAHVLDVRRILQRGLGRRAMRDLAVHCGAATARLCGGRRALAAALALLPSTPLRAAKVTDLGSEVLLRAADCTAFGARRIHARPPHPDERPAAALLPYTPRTTSRMDLAGLAARVTMAAFAAAPERRSEPLPLAAVATTAPPQLLPIDPDRSATHGVARDAAVDQGVFSDDS
ncbi:MAG: hypothetical protein AB7O97_10370 [Planctomycetota bacterium]